VSATRPTPSTSPIDSPVGDFSLGQRAASLLFALKGGRAIRRHRRASNAIGSNYGEARGLRVSRGAPAVSLHDLSSSASLRRPVVFCVSLPGPAGESLVYGSPVFEPTGIQGRQSRPGPRPFPRRPHARESVLRANPYLWFNFIPSIPRLKCPRRRFATMLKRLIFLRLVCVLDRVWRTARCFSPILPGAVLAKGTKGVRASVRRAIRRYFASWRLAAASWGWSA